MFATPEEAKEKPVEFGFEANNKFKEFKEAVEKIEKKPEAEEQRDRAAEAEELREQVREVRKEMKHALDGSFVPVSQEIKPPDAKPQKVNATAGPSKEKLDLFWFYTSQPGAVWGGISADQVSPEGEIQLVTSRDGTRRKFKRWVGKDGYIHSKLLEALLPTDSR
jgi:hypothetical protein